MKPQFLIFGLNRDEHLKHPIKSINLNYGTITSESSITKVIMDGETSLVFDNTSAMYANLSESDGSNLLVATLTDQEKTIVIGLCSPELKSTAMRHYSCMSHDYNVAFINNLDLNPSELAAYLKVKNNGESFTSDFPEITMDVYSTRLNRVVGTTTLGKLAAHTLKEMGENNLIVKGRNKPQDGGLFNTVREIAEEPLRKKSKAETKVFFDTDNLDTPLSGLKEELFKVMVNGYGGQSLTEDPEVIQCPDCAGDIDVMEFRPEKIDTGDTVIVEIQCRHCGARLAVSWVAKPVVLGIVE